MASSLGFMTINDAEKAHVNSKHTENLQHKLSSKKAQELMDKLYRSNVINEDNLADFSYSDNEESAEVEELTEDIGDLSKGTYVNQYYNEYTNPPPAQNVESELTSKINYIIQLLEDSSDEKVNSMTEEIVLYCFLGVFIIFMIDSFTKVGKYVR